MCPSYVMGAGQVLAWRSNHDNAIGMHWLQASDVL
jgi:hypothetical protein